MNELAIYIINYYQHLMTREEKDARYTDLIEQKLAHADSAERKEMLRDYSLSNDPKVRALLANGVEAFMTAVGERVLREHPNDVFLNLCPRCGALAKTPTAKQCPMCFFSWHGEV